jgi:hypothetical protein
MTATRPRPWLSSLPAPISAQRPMQGNERANTLGLCSIRAKLVRGQGLCGRHRPSQRQGGGARRGGASGAAIALLRSARPSAAQQVSLQCSCNRPVGGPSPRGDCRWTVQCASGWSTRQRSTRESERRFRQSAPSAVASLRGSWACGNTALLWVGIPSCTLCTGCRDEGSSAAGEGGGALGDATG